jgi:hypothetical protein
MRHVRLAVTGFGLVLLGITAGCSSSTAPGKEASAIAAGPVPGPTPLVARTGGWSALTPGCLINYAAMVDPTKCNAPEAEGVSGDLCDTDPVTGAPIVTQRTTSDADHVSCSTPPTNLFIGTNCYAACNNSTARCVVTGAQYCAIVNMQGDLVADTSAYCNCNP